MQPGRKAAFGRQAARAHTKRGALPNHPGDGSGAPSGGCASLWARGDDGMPRARETAEECQVAVADRLDRRLRLDLLRRASSRSTPLTSHGEELGRRCLDWRNGCILGVCEAARPGGCGERWCRKAVDCRCAVRVSWVVEAVTGTPRLPQCATCPAATCLWCAALSSPRA